MSARRSHLVGIAVALGLSSCAHPEARVMRVDDDWIRPRVEEAAQAALRCIRSEPDRVLELAVAADGNVRAFVEPPPAAPAEQDCANEEAARLHLVPSAGGLRVLITGDGSFLSPQSPRARALSLRARAFTQLAAVEACRVGYQRRKPGESGRIGLALTVAEKAAVSAVEIAASTVDDTASACVREAARALSLPEIAGTYRFSYFLAPQGILVGAPDVEPLDPYDLGLAFADLRAATDACVKRYRTPGRVLVAFSLGNDGVPISVSLERVAEGSLEEPEDLHADACLKKAAKRLRVLPFDGPPARTTLPITLR